MARRPSRPRHRPSTIDRLDPEIRELIGKLRIDHGWTIDEIRQRLVDMGQSVSRSALGRHVRSIEDVVTELRETQVYAEALARETGNADQSRMLDLNAQLLQANMFKLMLAAKDGEGLQLGPKDAKDFADALRSIALTRKTDLETIEKAEARGEAKARKEAARKLDAAGKKGELDPEALARAKRIMGFD
ncbi:phage protein Gp27 family protein [Sphingopyxis granuli]|uniref:phage protein Gp27 family protein n=1 Tax=Sphingopyxis granuli TaxID=267128 RepID=UPI001BB018C7|nr:phage protein Gp27 family protein [Sphingopyxis granuli]QUM72195.1 DUF3486 family protein [Sphingopyxis granuli]